MVMLFCGGIRPLPPDNSPTGIFKRACEAPLWLGREGLAGDAQADRRVHGGPEKALHQFPAAHFVLLAQRFPAIAAQLEPGSIGENLSAGDWNEQSVAIGDIFRLGDAVIQVSQPRSPCWKIDRRYGADGVMRFIEAEGLTGWYYRVIEEGGVEPGCRFERLERPAPHATLQHLWQLRWAEHPDAAELEAFAGVPGLTPGWAEKLRARARSARS